MTTLLFANTLRLAKIELNVSSSHFFSHSTLLYSTLACLLDDIKSDSGSSLGSEESLQNTAGPNFADFARHLSYEKQEDFSVGLTPPPSD